MKTNLLTEFFRLTAEENEWKTRINDGELYIYIPSTTCRFVAEACKLFGEYVSNYGNTCNLYLDSHTATITDKMEADTIILVML